MLRRTIIILWFCSSLLASSPLRITEFSVAGRQGLVDEDGDTPDWIEIQNITPHPVNLAGWTLADDSRSGPWSFPATNLPAGRFMIVFASGKNRGRPGSPLHTNFKLNADHGDITLKCGDEMSTITNYPPQVAGVSFGITTSTGTDASAPPYAYLSAPTPGSENAKAISLGPQIFSLDRSPVQPGKPDEPITITARIRTTQHRVAQVHLHYRVHFGLETEIEMKRGPSSNDPLEQTYSAVIPASIALPGEIIRYYVTAEDTSRNRSRWPLFAKSLNYSSYEGTIIPKVTETRLPIYHFFVPQRAPIDAGPTPAVLVHGGELYDNVLVSPHGQLSTNFPKPSFNLDFPHDHRFRYRTNLARVSDLKILGNFADKSKIRNTLAYEMIEATGSAGHFAFPIRMELNGTFFCVAEVVEDGDDRWLERVGLDPRGALYKMYSNLHPVTESEKKTRQHEDSEDLAELANALAEHLPLEHRVAYTLDHLNIPQCISYLVAMNLISSGDHGHKNYYLYRDTRNSGEWSILPWDVDLSWGRNWTKTYFDDRIYFDNPLSLYRAGRSDRGRNPLYNVFMEHPPFRQMFLRRLRTIVDQLLQPSPGSKISAIEKRINELVDLIDPPQLQSSDADLDSQKWPKWHSPRSVRDEAHRIIKEYLPQRRDFLLTRATLHGDRLPPSQPANATVSVAMVQHGTVAEQFIRIENLHNFAVDLSRWKLSGAGIEYSFPPGTVIPAGETLDVVADIRAMRSAKGLIPGKRRLQGNWQGTLASEGELRITDPSGRSRIKSAAPNSPTRELPIEGEVFQVEGRTAFLVPAESPASGKPWVWYAPTLPAYPAKEERWMFEQFTDAGISIAGIDVGESYGSPDGQKLYTALYREMTQRGYSSKPLLLGRSRGGLMTLNWAAENPGKASGFAGIYPVCDLESYPGIAKAASAYDLSADELQDQIKAHNPIDRLEPLAAAGVPLFAIHGDVDTLVPLEKNSQILHDRYKALGGSMQLIVASGQGHNMWTGFFQSAELVAFVKKNAR